MRSLLQSNIHFSCSGKMIHKEQNKKYPACFGDLETVFPKGEDGLRISSEVCRSCEHKTACLRSAMEGTEGAKVREEIVDRAYKAGAMSFFERWSMKKRLHRRLRENIKKTHQEGSCENH